MEANIKAVNQSLLRSCDPTVTSHLKIKAGRPDPAKPRNLKIT